MAYMGIDHSRIDYLSQLPLEIQLLILQKLDHVEFSCFNGVCKAWRSIASAARNSPFFHLQQVPWLIHRGREIQKLAHRKMFYRLELNLHDSSRICGSSEGWLLFTQSSTTFNNGSNNFLLNPITRQRISLPQNPQATLGVGVILPQSAVKGEIGLEVVAYFRDDCFYQWKSQDEHWTEIPGYRGISTISDMFYHKGKIYAVHNSVFSLFIINISSDRPYYCLRVWSAYVYHSLNPRFTHLVECDGDLLMVMRSSSYYCRKKKKEEEVSIFKYNPIAIQLWEKVSSIGEKYSLLVGKGNSMAIDISTNSTSFRANCVYFLDYDVDQGQGIRCFNLAKNEFETFMHYSWDIAETSKATPPTWFMPSLDHMII